MNSTFTDSQVNMRLETVGMLPLIGTGPGGYTSQMEPPPHQFVAQPAPSSPVLSCPEAVLCSLVHTGIGGEQ
jgi:hypothetical protein